MVVIAIIAALIGIAVPSLTVVRQRATKTACMSNLRQIGLAIDSYRADFRNVYPMARYIPSPFFSGDTDPSLPTLLEPYLPTSGAGGGGGDGGGSRSVYLCGGDNGYVHARCGTSYMYRVGIAGQTIEEFFPVKHWGLAVSEVPIANDFDGGTFDLEDGQVLNVPYFHDLRNLLFADGHVGNL
jgi:prepilin-type processing-associated H-X9-DG protein